MENAVYWQGRQVGIECAGRILWFTSAPKEVIDAYATPVPAEVTATADDVTACNLLKIAR